MYLNQVKSELGMGQNKIFLTQHLPSTTQTTISRGLLTPDTQGGSGWGSFQAVDLIEVVSTGWEPFGELRL